MRILLLAVMNLFILSCVFDPADTVLRLKVPLFILSWLVFFTYQKNLTGIRIPKELIVYVSLMILLPLLSITLYYLTNSAQPYMGLAMFKAYILISFAILLYLAKIDLMKSLCAVLTMLSIAIIALYVAVLVDPTLVYPLYLYGESSGIFSLGQRVYSENLKMWSIYFVTSPMLTISIAYYMNMAFSSENKRGVIFLVCINIFAMFIAGTRNNMFTSIFLPITIIVLSSRYKKVIALVSLILVSTFFGYYSEAIGDMLNPEEESNAVKIRLLGDYEKIFSDPYTLIFGQGLGSYYNWTGRGLKFDTEQTYLEIFRNFGIVMGSIIILLMLYPVIYGYYMNKSFKDRYLIVAYIFYLVMSATNPLFFSSLGMLILSIIIANIYLQKHLQKSVSTI